MGLARIPSGRAQPWLGLHTQSAHACAHTWLEHQAEYVNRSQSSLAREGSDSLHRLRWVEVPTETLPGPRLYSSAHAHLSAAGLGVLGPRFVSAHRRLVAEEPTPVFSWCVFIVHD